MLSSFDDDEGAVKVQDAAIIPVAHALPPLLRLRMMPFLTEKETTGDSEEKMYEMIEAGKWGKGEQ